MIIEDEPILVKIYYMKVGRSYTALSDAELEDKKKQKDFKTEGFKIVNIKMKPMTWGLYNELQEKSSAPDETGRSKFNFKLYKEQRLKNLIIEWDATYKNEKGEVVPLPVNETNIMKLAPEVAETILTSYDIVSFVSEEDEKKS